MIFRNLLCHSPNFLEKILTDRSAGYDSNGLTATRLLRYFATLRPRDGSMSSDFLPDISFWCVCKNDAINSKKFNTWITLR